MAEPKLIVFDLDYTLWPFWVDTHVKPPFKKKNDRVVDANGKKVELFPEVTELLMALKQKGFVLAIASRTDTPDRARQLMSIIDIDKYFTYKEIYPGCKITHFKRFHEQSGVPYNEMIFFDDEHRNIKDISQLGVTAKLVDRSGFNKKSLDDAMQTFAQKHKS